MSWEVEAVIRFEEEPPEDWEIEEALGDVFDQVVIIREWLKEEV